MSVNTTADEHVQRAQELIDRAREEIGKVLLDRDMWGAKDFRDGYIKNVFDRLDALSHAIRGGDPAGDASAAEVPRFQKL